MRKFLFILVRKMGRNIERKQKTPCTRINRSQQLKLLLFLHKLLLVFFKHRGTYVTSWHADCLPSLDEDDKATSPTSHQLFELLHTTPSLAGVCCYLDVVPFYNTRYLSVQDLLFEDVCNFVEHPVQVGAKLSHSVLHAIVRLEGAVHKVDQKKGDNLWSFMNFEDTCAGSPGWPSRQAARPKRPSRSLVLTDLASRSAREPGLSEPLRV